MRKRYTLLILTSLILSFFNTTYAQKSQGEIVVTTGVGSSLSLNILKTAANQKLKSRGLEKIDATPIYNATLDYGITEKFSLGGAYSYNKMTWTDEYSSTDTLIQALDTTKGDVLFVRNNISIRGLYHFGNMESLDIYGGARIGMSIWKLSATVENDNLESASNFSFPATLPSILVMVGARKYFGDFFGVHLELGLGTSPYFITGGINIKI